MGVTDPVPGKVTGKNGGFNAENFHAHNLFSHCNHTRSGRCGPHRHGTYRQHPYPDRKIWRLRSMASFAAGNYAAGLGVDTTHDEVNVSTEHVAKDLILAQHKVGVF